MINFKIRREEGPEKYTATVEGGAEMNPSAIFCGTGDSLFAALGHCVVANREALDITFAEITRTNITWDDAGISHAHKGY